MSIVHVEHRSHWTGIANAMLEDQRLSFKARGLLAYLLTKPEGWQTQTTQLCHASDQDGRSAIYSALEELATHGYATYEQPREAGRFVKGGWNIREVPQTGFPLTENPLTENPLTENRYLSKDLKKVKTEVSKTEELQPPVSACAETSRDPVAPQRRKTYLSTDQAQQAVLRSTIMDDAFKKWFAAKGLLLNLDDQWETFTNKALANGYRYIDWQRAFMNWLMSPLQQSRNGTNPAQQEHSYVDSLSGERILPRKMVS